MRLALVLLLVPAWSAAKDKNAPGRLSGAVEVREKDGVKADASGVVVYVVGFDEPPPAGVPEIRQKNKQFVPPLLPITAGQRVAFPNSDAFFHNVFSPSTARPFDLGQFKDGETRIVEFPRPGVVEVYCNIHPDMASTILILPNRRFATTASDGRYTIEGVPPGTYTVYAYSRRAERPEKAQAKVTAGKTTAVNFVIEETRQSFEHLNKNGEPYGIRALQRKQ